MRLLNVNHPLSGGQRSLDDVLVRITERSSGTSTVEYASPGRAAMMLTRYSRERWVRDSRSPFLVERAQVDPRRHDTLVTPIDRGANGYRSECATCGTVLRCHPTAGEADRWAGLHAADPSTYRHEVGW